MSTTYEYEAIRPKLWEVTGKNGRALGRIRHVFSPEKQRTGWQASNGKFYKKAENAAEALVTARKKKLEARQAN